jgi:hypothetical protein
MNRNGWAALVATIVVLVVVILGFWSLGGPGTQRLVQTDLHAVRALSSLAQKINQAWLSSGRTLPANLESVSDSLKRDSITGQIFGYRPGPNDEYELCANFATNSENLQGPNSDRWAHPKGDYCFKFDASTPVPFVPYY